MAGQKEWQPPEVKLMGFWDRLGLKMRNRRYRREAEKQADRARAVLAKRAQDAGIPVRKDQV